MTAKKILFRAAKTGNVEQFKDVLDHLENPKLVARCKYKE